MPPSFNDNYDYVDDNDLKTTTWMRARAESR